jgi:WD40 repeat protein
MTIYSNDARVLIWDANTGEQLAALTGHRDYAIRAAIDLENDLLATVAWDGYLILWGIPDR